MAAPPPLARRTRGGERASRPSQSGELAVRVHEPGVPHADTPELMEFMRRQRGVESVEHVLSSGTLLVHYDERRGTGRMLQGALLDRIFRKRAPAPPEPQRLEVSIAHDVPGRLRLKAAQPTPDDAVERLAAYVGTLEGVDRTNASPMTGSVLVHYDPARTSADAILAAISGSQPMSWPAASPKPRGPYVEWAKTAFGAAVLTASIFGVMPASMTLGAVALTAIPPYRRALHNLRHGHINVDVMDATAITVCLLRAEPITASVITALLALGDLILDRTHARARTAISRLMQLDDGEAFVLDAGATNPRRVHPRELSSGMRIVIYPGARVPADGLIMEGTLAVDEKALTGESVPREKGVGDRVMAASVAVQGQAVVLVERAGSDTVAAKIVQILEGAGAKPMTLQRNSEKYADRLVIPTFATAGAAYAFSGVMDRLTSVLITDFGTGIRVAVPTAALAAMIQAARAGVLVKGSQFLERLAEADTIVFDKTGTLTLGVPHVIGVARTHERFSEAELIAFAAGAEGNQTHPIANAIRSHAESIGAPTLETNHSTENYRIGLGLEARVAGHLVHIGSPRLMNEVSIDASLGEPPRVAFAARGASTLLLAIDGRLEAVIAYADAPRPESPEVVKLLRAGGRRRVILLSGDAKEPVQAIARHCGIDQAIADVLPEHKADLVRSLKAEGRKVAMVGDGINDAPALAVADVGISLRGGTEVALETADVVLLEGGLARLPEVFAVSDQAMKRVKEVLGVVLVPNALAIAAGAFGFLTPVLAATINNGSTIAAALHAVGPLLRRR